MNPVGILFYTWWYIFFRLPILVWYIVSDDKKYVFARFLTNVFRCGFFYMIHSMLELSEESKSLFYIKYLLYTHVLVLWIKGCKLFKNFICGVTKNKSFGWVIIAVNEICRLIIYILDKIFVLFYRWLYNTAV